jgi:hypothetical protein
MQSCCRRAHRHRFDGATKKLGEFLLEFAGFRSGGEPSGPQHSRHRFDLGLADDRAKARYRGVIRLHCPPRRL